MCSETMPRLFPMENGECLFFCVEQVYAKHNLTHRHVLWTLTSQSLQDSLKLGNNVYS